MCTFWFFGEVLFFDVRLICEQVRDVFERIASGPLEALPCKSMIPITRKGGFGIYTDFSTLQEKGVSACRQDFLSGVLNKAFPKAWSVYSLSSCVPLSDRLAIPLRVLRISHLRVSNDDSDLRADNLPKDL